MKNLSKNEFTGQDPPCRTGTLLQAYAVPQTHEWQARDE